MPNLRLHMLVKWWVQKSSLMLMVFDIKISLSVINKKSVYGQNCSNIFLFRPPSGAQLIPQETRKTSSWVTKHFLGLEWNAGTRDYNFLFVFCSSLEVRFPNSIFCVRGKKKCDSLRRNSFRVIDLLETVGCPKVTDFCSFIISICYNHNRCGHFLDHCPRILLQFVDQSNTSKCL